MDKENETNLVNEEEPEDENQDKSTEETDIVDEVKEAGDVEDDETEATDEAKTTEDVEIDEEAEEQEVHSENNTDNDEEIYERSKEQEVHSEEDVESNEEPEGQSYVEDDEESDYYDAVLSELDELSDEEAILLLDEIVGHNDELIEEDYLSSLVSQGERLVYYEVEDIYQGESKKRYKNRHKLKRNPPVLIVRDSDENEVRFYLTEHLTDELSDTLKEVKRAYYGFNGPKDKDAPEKLFDRIKYYIKTNPFKILATILLILFILSLSL